MNPVIVVLNAINNKQNFNWVNYMTIDRGGEIWLWENKPYIPHDDLHGVWVANDGEEICINFDSRESYNPNWRDCFWELK